jgi:hypothetical protein
VDQAITWGNKTLQDALSFTGYETTEQTILNWKNGSYLPKRQAQGPLLRTLADREESPYDDQWRKAFLQTTLADKKLGPKARKEAYRGWAEDRDGKNPSNPMTELIRRLQEAEKVNLAKEAEELELENAVLRARSTFIPETVKIIEDAERLESEGHHREAELMLIGQETRLRSDEDEALQVLEGLARNRLAIGKNRIKQAEDAEEGETAFTLFKSAYVTLQELLNSCPTSFVDVLKSANRNVRKALDGCVANTSYGAALSLIEAAVRNGIADNRSSWRRLLLNTESLGSARTLLSLMKTSGLLPDVVDWTIALNKAKTFDQASSVIGMMRDAKPKPVPPNVVTFNTLMNKAKTFDQASSVIGMMRDAKPKPVPPDVVTFNTLMNKAKTLNDAIKAMSLWKPWGQFGNQVFGALTQNLARRMSAENVFKSCFGASRKVDLKFPTTAFQQAVSEFMTQHKYSDAFRICVAFPHLPGCVKAMKSVPQEAEVFFIQHMDEEPNHASYALATLFHETGIIDNKLHWCNIALKENSDMQYRLRHIREMMDAP